MNKIRMSDIINNLPKRVMLYGFPGAGKTSLAISGSKKKLLVDLERGIGRAVPNDRTDVWTPALLGDLFSELTRENVKEYDVIVIDTLGRLVEMLVKKHSGSGGVTNQNTWGAVRREVSNWWNALLGLNKHIILIAHGKLEDGGSYVPEIQGKSPALIVRDLDYIGVVKDHKVMFNMPNTWCKNTHSKMPDEVSTEEKGLLEMLLESGETQAEAEQKPSAVDEAIIIYEKTIESVTNCNQLNSTYRWLAENAKDTSWKTMLNEKAKSMNCGFDTSKRSFQYAV